MTNRRMTVLRDITEQGLDPRVAHTKVGKDGKLRANTRVNPIVVDEDFFLPDADVADIKFKDGKIHVLLEPVCENVTIDFDVRPAVLSPDYGDELPTEPTEVVEEPEYALEIKNDGRLGWVVSTEDVSQHAPDEDFVDVTSESDKTVVTVDVDADIVTDEQILTDHPDWAAELVGCKPMVRANKMKKFRRLVRENAAKTE